MDCSRSPLCEITPTGKYSSQDSSNDDFLCVEDTLSLINDFHAVLKAQDNAKEIRNINQQAVDVKLLCNEQFTNAKDILRQMGCTVQNLERQLVPPPPTEELTQQLVSIDNKQKENLGVISAFEREMSEDETAIAALSEKLEKVQIEAKEAANRQQIEIPKVQHSVGLYHTISGIRWDYSNPKLAGVMNSDTDVRAFELDPKLMTECQIADALWDMIGSR